MNQKGQPTTKGHNINWLLHNLFSRGDIELCKKIIDKRMLIDIDKEYLFFMQGTIYQHEHRYNEALECYQEAISRFSVQNNNNNNNNNYIYYKKIAKTLYLMGRHKQALDVYFKAEKIMERPDYEVYHNIGELMLRNIQMKPNESKILLDAIEYFKRALIDSKQPKTYYKLAEIYTKQKDYMKAIEMYENSLQIAHDNVEVLTKIGILYLKINETQRAFDKLTEANHLNDNSTKTLIALGAILQYKNDADAALNKYKKIADLQEQGVELWNNIGLCFYRKQKCVAAISCLKKAVWMSPLNDKALYNLGLILLSAQQYASAFQMLASAVCINPLNAEGYMLLGVCLYYLNDSKNAVSVFEKSVMLPDAVRNPLIYLNFAVFSFQIKKYEESQQYLDIFHQMIQHMSTNKEYMRMADRLKLVLTMEIEQQTTNFKQQIENPIAYDDKINSDSGDDDEKIDSLVNTSAGEMEQTNKQIDDNAYDENNEH